MAAKHQYDMPNVGRRNPTDTRDGNYNNLHIGLVRLVIATLRAGPKPQPHVRKTFVSSLYGLRTVALSRACRLAAANPY